MAPTAFRRRINGLVALFRDPFADDWTDAERDVLAEIAAQLGIAHAQLDHIEALDRQASTDALTGLLNRRRFVSELEARIAACKRSGVPGALIYVDLDNFKAVNDILGHQAGDTALKQVARTLRKATRINDLVARLGGDEFALWLDGADQAIATGRAERLRQDAPVALAHVGAGPDLPLSISIGIAVRQPGSAERLRDLLIRADQAMYDVKRAGRAGWLVG